MKRGLLFVHAFKRWEIWQTENGWCVKVAGDDTCHCATTINTLLALLRRLAKQPQQPETE